MGHSGVVATGEQRVEVGGRTLKVSNLDKVMYPATGTTKGEVIDMTEFTKGSEEAEEAEEEASED